MCVTHQTLALFYFLWIHPAFDCVCGPVCRVNRCYGFISRPRRERHQSIVRMRQRGEGASFTHPAFLPSIPNMNGNKCGAQSHGWQKEKRLQDGCSGRFSSTFESTRETIANSFFKLRWFFCCDKHDTTPPHVHCVLPLIAVYSTPGNPWRHHNINLGLSFACVFFAEIDFWL